MYQKRPVQRGINTCVKRDVQKEATYTYEKRPVYRDKLVKKKTCARTQTHMEKDLQNETVHVCKDIYAYIQRQIQGHTYMKRDLYNRPM